MTTENDIVTLEVIDGPELLDEPRERHIGNNPRFGTFTQTHASTYDIDGEHVWEHYAYKVRLRYQGRTMSTTWKAGLLHLDPPTARDVLEGLFSDAACYDNARDFEEFAADLGYDTDSRKAEQTYRACGTIARKLARLLAVPSDQLAPWQEHGCDELAERYAGGEVTAS